MLETTSGPKFYIQAKTERLNSAAVTWHVLLAFGEDNAAFEVSCQQNYTVELANIFCFGEGGS